MKAKQTIGSLALIAALLAGVACSLSFSFKTGNTPDTPGRKDFSKPPSQEGDKKDWTTWPKARIE